jgi:hypothetical protein
MRTISDSVRQIVYQSEGIMTALRAGHLNMSSYAKTIHGDIEEATQKSAASSSH